MFNNISDLITQLVTNIYVVTGLFGIVIAMALGSCCLSIPGEIDPLPF